MSNTLWSAPTSNVGKVIHAVAAITNVRLSAPASYEPFVDNLKPEFLEKFPLGKIPALQRANGFTLFEGPAIARYLAGHAPEKRLLGDDPESVALVDQWIHLSESEVDNNTYNIIAPINGWIPVPYSKESHVSSASRQLRALRVLNAHLESRTFFVGDHITLADIFVAAHTLRAVAVTIDASLRKELPNLIRHLEFIANQEKIKEAFGPIEYIERAIEYVAPK